MAVLRKRKSLAFKSLFVVCLIFFIPILLQAGESIPLPQDLSAKAFVTKAERDGLWEKSLIVQFPERRRVLSTNDGFMDAIALVNHSAHPELWKRVCQEMKTKDEVGGKVYSRKVKEGIAERLGIRVKTLHRWQRLLIWIISLS